MITASVKPLCGLATKREIHVNTTSCGAKNRLKNEWIPLIPVIKIIRSAKPQSFWTVKVKKTNVKNLFVVWLQREICVNATSCSVKNRLRND